MLTLSTHRVNGFVFTVNLPLIPSVEIIAFVTDVAHHHRNVTEECVFNFQGAG